MQAYNYVKNVVKAAGGKEQFKNITQQFINYGTNLQNAIQGKELFTTSSSTTQTLQVDPTITKSLDIFFIVYMIVSIILSAVYCAGAARLSYCYNIVQGSSAGTAIFWAALAFLFAPVYYPVYGLLLASCGSVAVNTAVRKIGGGRH